MCGRYAFVPHRHAWASIEEVLGAEIAETLRGGRARYNIAPTTKVPIVVEDRQSGQPRVIEARWGLIPHWWKALKPPTNTINARCEEAADKPMWRHAWRHMRCLVPATHYYEWQALATGDKLPYALTRQDGGGFMFAGLWALRTDPVSGKEEASCAILTRRASADIIQVHERMPLILAPQGWKAWLQRSLADPDTVKQMAESFAVLDVQSFRISRRVNTARNDDAGLLDPE